MTFYAFRRRALHQYDPPDLMKVEATSTTNKFRLAKKDQLQSKQALELAQATQKGLLVDVSQSEKEESANHSPPCIISASLSMRMMDKWEQTKDIDCMDDDFAAMDSDDDLL